LREKLYPVRTHPLDKDRKARQTDPMTDLDTLASRALRTRQRPLTDLFAEDPNRVSRFSLEQSGLHFDFSRSHLDADDYDALVSYARSLDVEGARAAMFAGKAINLTEDRAVLHMALRQPDRAFMAKGEPVSEAIAASRAAATAFARDVLSGRMAAFDGRPFKSVLHLGIGGSDLGPRVVYEALAPTAGTDITLRFAANVEPGELAAALVGLDPAETLIICVSKTFTTLETLENLKAARAWLQIAIGPDDSKHLVAVSAAPARTAAMGFASDRVFDFRDWVGGRFSLWSAVGLSVEIALGPDVIAQFHKGAAEMDTAFETLPLEKNPPVMAALIGWWNRSLLGYQTRAIIPYARRLRLLPQFLQQLDMESNGKGVDRDGRPVTTSCPIVWGAEGTNAQHAFFQHLHQSPDVTPVEFIAIAQDTERAPDRTRMTLANVLAQAEALMHGKTLASVEQDMASKNATREAISQIAPHRVFSGNRPSTFTLLESLTPHSFGAFLSFCEHRTFVEGRLWGVNSFDQWGVELGKGIASEIDVDLKNGPSQARDAASAAMINKIRALRG
jgi:glucose-6-phosphate isomerase